MIVRQIAGLERQVPAAGIDRYRTVNRHHRHGYNKFQTIRNPARRNTNNLVALAAGQNRQLRHREA